MARRSSVIRPNHEMALPSCQLVGARRASQAVALARGGSHAPCAPSGARRANHLREQMLHMPYDEPGRIGVGWPRSEFADEPDGVLHRCRLIRERSPDLAVEGEMRGDAALSQFVLDHEFPDSGFVGPANVLVMPNLDAANISYNLLRMAA